MPNRPQKSRLPQSQMELWHISWAKLNPTLKALYFGPSKTSPPSSLTNDQNVTNEVIPQTPADFRATNMVLNTIELLEQVLENCLLNDLLTFLPRVCKTWKCAIDKNSRIQKDLFFTPWGPNNYETRCLRVNPYLELLNFKKGEVWNIKNVTNCGPVETHTEEEDTDNDANEAGWGPEPDRQYLHAINWRMIEDDPSFMYEKASWRRMLPIQPPKRTVWFVWRGGRSAQKEMRSIRENGKLLGDIYEDIITLEKDPLCRDTITTIATSKRYGAMMQVDISMTPLADEDNDIERGESLFYKTKGSIRWMSIAGFRGKAYYGEWGSIPWFGVGEDNNDDVPEA